jgi:adenosine deaminase
VDLAGFEDISTRAHYFREDFLAVHRCGLALTVHAGENDDAEGIWSAVFDLNARRLGHALSLRESPDLLRSVADRRIGIEMCPYANFQIKGFAMDESFVTQASGTHATTVPSSQRLDATTVPSSQRLDATYPLLAYLRAGVSVTVNTDNIGISAASLTENFLLLPRLCPGIRRLDVLQLLRNAIDQSFLDTAAKNHLLAEMNISHR